jgi:hypothetical protein
VETLELYIAMWGELPPENRRVFDALIAAWEREQDMRARIIRCANCAETYAQLTNCWACGKPKPQTPTTGINAIIGAMPDLEDPDAHQD